MVDFNEYVAARRGRLVEHAVLLGCPAADAGVRVDQVLREQRRRISVAEDPDGAVRAALERAISGRPQRPRRRGTLVVAGVVLAVVAVTGVLHRQPAPRQLPSLFALDGAQAERVLAAQGFDVRLVSEGSCDPKGMVVGSMPASGARAEAGGTVTVHTSVVSGSQCEATFPWRVLAWQFFRFVLDLSETPTFAGARRVYVDGRPALHRWEDLATLVAHATSTTTDAESGLPVLEVERLIPPARSCGVHRPPGERTHSAVRLQLTDSGEEDCPLTIDLYRNRRGRITTIAAYPPRG